VTSPLPVRLACDCHPKSTAAHPGYDGPGTAPRDFSDGALSQSYAPDGLLYVLDYGNGRVQVPDPANGYAASPVHLSSGVTTANMQFAIGNNGTLTSAIAREAVQRMASDGTYLGAFFIPALTSSLAGQPYVSVDGKGDIFVFDTTGDS
jgi:hypothetical protein